MVILQAGRVTPDLPPVTGDGRRKCAYCSRWSAGTQCEGCGAPLQLDAEPKPDTHMPNKPLGTIIK